MREEHELINELVGYTGFVGSNIYEAGSFDSVFNSRNIEEAYGTNPDLLIYAGVRAEKYLANHAPEKDMKVIEEAEKNIVQINPKKLVLISTIDVFKNPYNVDENSKISMDSLHPYGYNRYKLELWVREMYPSALIIRLPGLFGKNIKKNFIFDYITLIPSMLKEEKMEGFSRIDSEIKDYYVLQDNGFYKVKELSKDQSCILKEKFKKLGFSALNFTDSRSMYQFYDLGRLWNDINIALEHGLKLWHPATEPVSAGELYKYLAGKEFINELAGVPVNYNYKTIYAGLFGGDGPYIETKEQMLDKIYRFVKNSISNQ